MRFSPFSWQSRGGNLRRQKLEQQRKQALDAIAPDVQRQAQAVAQTAGDTERRVGDLFGQRQAAATRQRLQGQRSQRDVARAFEPEPMDVRTRMASIFRSKAKTADEGRRAIDRDRLERGGQKAQLFSKAVGPDALQAARVKAFAKVAEREKGWLETQHPGMLPSEALRAELAAQREAGWAGLEQEVTQAVPGQLQEIAPTSLPELDFIRDKAFESVVPEPALEQIERVPVAGPTLRNVTEQVTSPVGAAATLAFPEGMVASTVGQVVGGTAGEVAERAGAPEWASTAGEIAGAVAGPGVAAGAKRLLPSERLAAELAAERGAVTRPTTSAVSPQAAEDLGQRGPGSTPLEGEVFDSGASAAPATDIARTTERENIMRVIEPGSEATTAKPHGLYFTFDRGVPSPHADIGGEVMRAVPTPKNPLRVGEMNVAHARFRPAATQGPASAGVAALRDLVGEPRFAQLLKMDKRELTSLLENEFPGGDYSRYYDSYELLEAYAGQLARSRGYDAIIQVGAKPSEWDEFVALTDDSFSAEQSNIARTTERVAPLDQYATAFHPAVAEPDVGPPAGSDLGPPSAGPAAAPTPLDEVAGVRVDVDEPAFAGRGVGAAMAQKAPTLSEVERTTARPSIANRRSQAEYKLSRLSDRERSLTYDEVRQSNGDRYQRTLLDPIFNRIRTARKQDTKLIQDVRNEMIARDVYVRQEGGVLNARGGEWLGKHTRTLGINLERGKMEGVQLRPGANVPKEVAQTPKDIARHPEDYIFTPEQQGAWDEMQTIFQRNLANEQRHGIDIVPIEEGYYWPEAVLKAPTKSNTPVYRPTSQANMTVNPWFTKSRTGIDPRQAKSAGVEYANDFSAMFLRLEGSAEAVANRSAVDAIKGMGYKPTEKIAQNVTKELADAQSAYQDARKFFGSTDLSEVRLYEAARDRLATAKQAARREARLVNERAPKLFGRVVPQDVAEEFSRYIAKEDPAALDEMFRVYRTILVNGDYGSPMLQNYALFWNNPKAWLKATGMGAAAIRKAPFEYLAQNADEVERAIRLGFISPPTELMLSHGGSASQRIGQLPVLKQAQRMFEWNIFVGQLERAKAHMLVIKDDKALREIADVTRKQAGILFEPGTTAKKAKWMSRLWFAPQYTAALNSIFLDPLLKRGPAQREAIKSMGMMLGGAASAAIGFNYMLNNELPNMDDPKKDGFWGIKLPDGTYVYPFGPLQPTIKALAETGISRDPKALPRFFESKAGVPTRWMIAAAEAMGLPVESLRGPAFGSPNKKLSMDEAVGMFRKRDIVGGVQQLGEQGLVPIPLGLGQSIKAGQRGAPFGILEAGGIRTQLPPSEAAARYRLRQELDKIAPFAGLDPDDHQKIRDFENQIQDERSDWLADPANAGRDIEPFSKSVAREAPKRLDPVLARWATMSDKGWDANRNPERDRFILDNWEVFEEHYPNLITQRLSRLRAERGRATNRTRR